mgnify:CR=1 FL=1
MSLRRVKGKAVFYCEKCGFSVEAREEETRIVKVGKRGEEVKVIERAQQLLPSTRKMCPRCGNFEVYYELRQTRAADEPPTQIFRCKRCGYVWREY